MPPSTPTNATRARLRSLPRQLGRADWRLFAGMALVALFLLPARFAAIRADDTWVSESRGQNTIEGHGMLEFIWSNARHFAETGRPGVAGIFQGLSTAWVIGDHPVAYHALLIVLTAVAAGLLYTLVRQLGLPRPGALLVTVLLAGALQLRSYHDPLLGYWGTLQIVLILVLGSLIAFQLALRRGSRRLLWLSAILFMIAPLLYEGAFTLASAFVAIALFERRGMAALRACLPFLAIAFVFVCASLLLRANATVIPPGYEVGSSPWAALRTYVVQLFAAIPASNMFFRADVGSFLPLGGNPTGAELVGAAWRGVVVFVLVLVLSLRLGSRDGSALPSSQILGRLAILGAMLWTTAGVAVAIAPKYQLEIVPGKNHLPSIIEAFGWALVAAAALLGLQRVAARRSRLALYCVALGGAALLGLAAGVTAFNNLRVVGLETPIAQTRALIERAASDGVFDAVPERGTLLFSSRDLQWNTGFWDQYPISLEGMLIDHTSRRFDARMIADAEQPPVCPATGAFPPPECAIPAGYDAWVRVRARPGGGSVIVATLPPRTRRPLSARTRMLRVYARNEPAAPTAPRLIALTSAGRPWDSAQVHWRRVARGDGYAVFEGSVPALRAQTVDDSGSKFSFAGLGPPEQIVRIYGAKRLLP